MVLSLGHKLRGSLTLIWQTVAFDRNGLIIMAKDDLEQTSVLSSTIASNGSKVCVDNI